MVKYDENDYLAYSRLAKSAQVQHPNHKHYKHHHAKKLRKHRQAEDVPPNEAMRTMVWEMFRNSPKEEFKLENLFNFYRVAYKFIMEDADFSGFLSLPEIKHMYTVETKGNYLQLKENQLQYIFQIVQFFNELQFATINIKQFFTFFSMREVMGRHSVASTQNIFMGKEDITKIGETRFMLKFTQNMFIAAKIVSFQKDASKVEKDQQLFDGIIAFRAALKYEVMANKATKIKGAESRLKKAKVSIVLSPQKKKPASQKKRLRKRQHHHRI